MTKIFFFLSSLYLTNSVSPLSIQSLQKDDKPSEEDILNSYNEQNSIKEIMQGHTGDFDVEMFSRLLTQPDINHLLYSQVITIMY